MKYRKLGATDIEIPAIVMGCWAIGGGYNWGEQNEADSIDTIRAAIDAGINMFDTSKFFWYSDYICTKFDNCRTTNTDKQSVIDVPSILRLIFEHFANLKVV